MEAVAEMDLAGDADNAIKERLVRKFVALARKEQANAPLLLTSTTGGTQDHDDEDRTLAVPEEREVKRARTRPRWLFRLSAPASGSRSRSRRSD